MNAWRRQWPQLRTAVKLPVGTGGGGLRVCPHSVRFLGRRLGQELAKWAERQPGGVQIHDALYRAYFVDGVNLAKVDELVRIAESLDLSGDEAREVLEARAEQQAVDLDWERSRQLGVTGVPTFLSDNKAVVGAQPYEMLEALVTRAGARKRE